MIARCYRATLQRIEGKRTLVNQKTWGRGPSPSKHSQLRVTIRPYPGWTILYHSSAIGNTDNDILTLLIAYSPSQLQSTHPISPHYLTRIIKKIRSRHNKTHDYLFPLFRNDIYLTSSENEIFRMDSPHITATCFAFHANISKSHTSVVSLLSLSCDYEHIVSYT